MRNDNKKESDIMTKNMDFNEWLLSTYGITSDDMTDDDYDAYYELWRNNYE